MLILIGPKRRSTWGGGGGGQSGPVPPTQLEEPIRVKPVQSCGAHPRSGSRLYSVIVKINRMEWRGITRKSNSLVLLTMCLRNNC